MVLDTQLHSTITERLNYPFSLIFVNSMSRRH